MVEPTGPICSDDPDDFAALYRASLPAPACRWMLCALTRAAPLRVVPPWRGVDGPACARTLPRSSCTACAGRSNRVWPCRKRARTPSTRSERPVPTPAMRQRCARASCAGPSAARQSRPRPAACGRRQGIRQKNPCPRRACRRTPAPSSTPTTRSSPTQSLRSPPLSSASPPR